jgi:hypothetical protein
LDLRFHPLRKQDLLHPTPLVIDRAELADAAVLRFLIPHGIKPGELGAKDSMEPAPAVVVNVRDLRARADGQTADAPAIQQAINRVARTGGCVLLPPSEHPYLIGCSLAIAADNVELEGGG